MIKIILYILSPLILFSGCGSDDNHGVGVFKDSPVEGLAYQTNSMGGYTNANGEFLYNQGEIVTFKIGNLSIGSSIAKPVVEPVDLVSGADFDDVRVINIARLLQSFDDDGKISDTIVLSDEAKSLDVTGLDINFSNEAFIVDVHSRVKNARKLVSKEYAKAHLTSTMTDIDGDGIPNIIEQLIGSNPNKKSVDKIDPYFSYQWHINSIGQVATLTGVKSILGNDLNILEINKKYMGYNDGNPIEVMVVDDGVDIYHEDLIANINLFKSINTEPNSLNLAYDPSPKDGEYHGTQVAGIIAARAFNGVGVRGIAPFARLSGSNFLSYPSISALELSLKQDTAVSNNSWGSFFQPVPSIVPFIKYGVMNNRGGLGTIYVFAAGNERQLGHDMNLDQDTATRFVINVAALNSFDIYSSYSSPGAGNLISGYGGEYGEKYPAITTTYPTAKAKSYFSTHGYNSTGFLSVDEMKNNHINTFDSDKKLNYTTKMNGTSSAAPTVSGSIALLLEACPILGWRDVKQLLATTAIKVDSDNKSWVTNAAGLHFSRDYGFGKIDTLEMIARCQDGYSNLPMEKSIETLTTVNEDVPYDGNILENTLNVYENISVESINLKIDSTYEYASNLEIRLTSPNGTSIVMMAPNSANSIDKCVGKCEEFSAEYNPFYIYDMNLVTAGFMGETSQGTWRVEISSTDRQSSNNRAVNSIGLKIYGH
ncbi:MAG: S8 family serine peptidase [Campylobacterota bacterium]|nr:S8 family serine peptidase [Campylobacterota bacterium]